MLTNHLRSALCVVILGLLAGLTGCSSPSTPGVTWSLTGTVWKVAEINGEMIGADAIPTLTLEAGTNQVSGTGGVNRFSGTYKLDGAALSFGPLITSMMAGPPAQMEVERRYLQMLATVTGHRARDQWLVLLAGDKVVARAQATPAAP